ncbi:MAG: transcriptional regulator GutM [Brevefilum sp.]|nr:transcriptional regulator GutM [Brevefilum sp.]
MISSFLENFNYSYIFIILAVTYALQLLLTGWQAKRFYRRLRELRKDGLLSIGLSGGKWSGRTYAVLVVDKNLDIINAGKLSGMTVFSQLKTIDEVIGLNARDLLEESRQFEIKKKLLEAFRNAAKAYFDESGEPVSETKINHSIS